ncbi:MAG: AMP-binding protein, partial [bacterium]|nr:AMP-binding protein [bacterium]
ETHLAKHESIKDTVVIDRDDSGESYLCAYIVPVDSQVADSEAGQPSESVSVDDLNDYLSRVLPDYMLPSYYVELDKLPLTLAGKIDRKRLPRPRVKAGADYTAPRTVVEKALVAIWSDILAVDSEVIGIDANFFSLGGHSLRATQVSSRIHKELTVRLPLVEMFKKPTIRGLAAFIKTADQKKYEAIAPVEKREYYPLSSAQKRMYFLQQVDLESVAYNMPMSFPMGRDVDKVKLENALKQLIARHESLRTAFVHVAGEPVQRIYDTVDFKLEYYDLSQDTSPNTPALGFQGEPPLGPRRAPGGPPEASPFALDRAPLLRSCLLRDADGEYVWMVDLHHIISDGTSHSVLTADFGAMYGGGTLEPLRLHYKDFSQWQNGMFEGGEIDKQQEYWMRTLEGVGDIPRAGLPVDYKRPKTFSFEGAHCRFVLEGEALRNFRALGSEAGGTLYMNLLAALNTLFYKYNGLTDIVLGCGVAGRPHTDLLRIIGMFVNTLAMRNFPGDEKSYRGFLNEVVGNSVEAFENQDIQFEELVDKLEVERDPSRNPVFDVSMVVQNFQATGQNMGRGGEGETGDTQNTGSGTGTSKFDLAFFVYESEESLRFTVEYYTAIFKPATIERMVRHFKNLIAAVAAGPGDCLKDIDIVSSDEREQLLYHFNDTAAPYPGDKSLTQLFEEQVDRTPDNVALIYRDFCMTYALLDRECNRLAHFINSQQLNTPALGFQGPRHAGSEAPPFGPPGGPPEASSGAMVGILMTNPVLQMVAVVGILKAGCAYVAVDANMPEERIKFIVEDTALDLVISEKRFIRTLNRLQWECSGPTGFLCLDSYDIEKETETEESNLMNKEFWEMRGENADDDIAGGSWFSSYTGQLLSKEEMDEYGDNTFYKLQPLLHKHMKVLEIGAATGLTMYRVAPEVGLFYGTDLSSVIIESNKKKIEQENISNIKLAALAAHEIETIEERDFDLIIINSVIQCFHGHNYLRQVLSLCLDKLADKGRLFIGDIMDLDTKDAMIRDLTEFKNANKDKGYVTKTDVSDELIVPRDFWRDFAHDNRAVTAVEFSTKIHTLENELTKYRYDAEITIDKSVQDADSWRENEIDAGRGDKDEFSRKRAATGFDVQQRRLKEKYRYDLSCLSRCEASDRRPKLDIPADSPAYIIYTSGTTGRPKGVIINHGNVVNLMVPGVKELCISPDQRMLLSSSISFDGSVLQIWPPFLNGAGLVLQDKEILLDNDRFESYCLKHKLTHMLLVPAFISTIRLRNMGHIQKIMAAGEVFPVGLAEAWYKRCEMFNVYGPTETTVISIYHYVEHIEANQSTIPIGKPLQNTRTYILDKFGNVSPLGVIGDLYIGGAGLSRGYLNNPELTAEKFIMTDLIPGEKLYRTGDLARWLPGGHIEFMGRADQQVKIRGFRVEPGEIENLLEKHAAVKKAVVLDRGEIERKYLCAYVVPAGETDPPNAKELKSHLAALVQDYMVPDHFVFLSEVPLTTGGKINRKMLPDPLIQALGSYVAPTDEVERKLVEIWSDAVEIGPERIGIDTGFFEIGGHSLSILKVKTAIKQHFGKDIAVADMFRLPTIRDLAAHLKEEDTQQQTTDDVFDESVEAMDEALSLFDD